MEDFFFSCSTYTSIVLSFNVYTYQPDKIGALGGPPLAVTISMMAGALVLAMNIRWSPILGAILMMGYLIAFAFQPFVPHHLTQPKIQFATFLAVLLLIVVLGIGLVASIAPLVEHIRQQVVPSPACFGCSCWLRVVLCWAQS